MDARKIDAKLAVLQLSVQRDISTTKGIQGRCLLPMFSRCAWKRFALAS